MHEIIKLEDLTGQFNIQKSDKDKRLAFGWANVAIRKDGEQIIDYQGDMFDPEDLEEAAYKYVLNFGDAGEEHIPFLRKKAKMVESVVFTKEKLRAMGLPEDALPQGWWIGFKVFDDDTWEKIKNGTYKMFSIEGTGIREKVPDEELMKKKEGSFTFLEMLNKFNPYHDRLGRFANADGAASFTIRTKDPSKQHWADRAVAREKERTKNMGGAETTQSGPKKGLVRGLGQAHAEKLESLVAESTDPIKNVWNKYGDEITVASASSGRGKCDAAGQIYVHIDRDSQGTSFKAPYETTMHESGHSIDRAISKKVGYRFSVEYKDGLFEKTLIKEANDHIKKRQKELEADYESRSGVKQKVPIQYARDSIGAELRKGGSLATGDVSDIFEGATKGKISGSAGHGKSYWTGRTIYGMKIPGHSVAVEAFAEMFGATTTSPKSLEQIKKYFPESYKVFEEMISGI